MAIHDILFCQWTGIASGIYLFLAAWQWLCKYPPPWMNKMESLGQPRAQRKLPGTAVVCGGSVAGIVTARICADHFERVVIIDPEIQDSEKPKTRIAQYNAVHIFLSLFVDGVWKLWPNLEAEVEAAGSRTCLADYQVHYSGLPLLVPFREYVPGHFPCSIAIRRSTLQAVLYRLLFRYPTASNITVMPGTVRALHASEDGTSIQTVVVRGLDGTTSSVHDAAMVADCTGATQAGVKWLEAAGFALPAGIRQSYDANLRYVTVCFNVHPALAAKLPIPEAVMQMAVLYTFVPHGDAESSTIAIMKTDNDTMLLLIGSTGHGDLPHRAPEIIPFIAEFKGYSRKIPSWVIETIDALCEHGNPVFNNLKMNAQSYVRYDRAPLGSVPSNFVALGDATMQLNPTHGQGCTKAMMNATTLNYLLHKTESGPTGLPADFSARFFKNSATDTQALWDSTRLHDYGLESCTPIEGETKEKGRLLRWFERKVLSAATKDEEVASALWHIRHMRAADRSLFAPTVLWKVLLTRSIF
ncbi:hypothetical protein B0H15DRAFT_340077 [Mycena belliarum]|uniref:FAD/NAD(P)-binding domain-containing protein n=1 Tax=Mycena belliarum TaxID=1033014 RepID=A0AAD6UGR6_9AGAR|nr:hypothetical protein B0H15DRAFT_340077 [Mycena belliae]